MYDEDVDKLIEAMKHNTIWWFDGHKILRCMSVCVEWVSA